MSDNSKPKINVTRGKKQRTNKQKSTRTADTGGGFPNPLAMASGLARRAREMWLAGLGAVSVAQEAGAQVFEALVEEGKSWEQERREQTERTARQVEQITEEGTEAVEAVEERVRTEVNNALHRVGVPHRDDLDALQDEVDALAEKIDRLTNAVAGEGEDD